MSIKYNKFGEVISVNGLTTGQKLGTPMQDAIGTKEENSPYYVQNATVSNCKNTIVDYVPTEPSCGSSATPEQLAQIEKNKNDISQLSSEIANLKNTSLVEPMEDDIPKVFIDGVIPTTKDDVLAEMTYVSKTDEFHAYLKIKCQGSSSMQYPKKNFTIKMYEDVQRETKLKKEFKDWKFKQNKYVLKANYIDHSHARNIVSARLWSEVVASRSDYDSLPTELKTSPNNGAIDGFPIKLYANGTYQGIYTWNIGKDDWMWNMDEDNSNHVLMCAETNTDGVYAETPCNFRTLWNGVNEEYWSVEVGTNSDDVKNSLNALISCVKDTDDETFMATIGTYLDLQSAIDYYIHQYIICGIDGLAKNMLLGTYDLQKWIMGAYDMDSTFGLFVVGSHFVPATTKCPEEYKEEFSLLWERIESLYGNRMLSRYTELRKTVYSISNMFTKFENFIDSIGTELYKEDLEHYPDIPSSATNNISQLREFIKDRLNYCDVEFTNIGNTDITSITLSKTELVFDTPDDETLLFALEPEIEKPNVTWTSLDESVAIVSQDGKVTPVGLGKTTIVLTIGSSSAVCIVTVNKVINWSETASYNFNSTTGEVVDGDCYISDLKDLENGYRYVFNGGENGNYVRAVLYRDGVFYKNYNASGDGSIGFDGGIEGQNTNSFRVGVHPKNTNIELDTIYPVRKGIWSTGRYRIDKDTGIPSCNESSSDFITLQKIPAVGGATYKLRDTHDFDIKYKTIYQYSKDGVYLGYLGSNNNTDDLTETLHINTAYVMLSASGDYWLFEANDIMSFEIVES